MASAIRSDGTLTFKRLHGLWWRHEQTTHRSSSGAVRFIGGLNVSVRYQLVKSSDDASRYGFHGSPSILLDGVDPFVTEHTEVGYARRTLSDVSGRPTGGPSVDQIAGALGVKLLQPRR